MTRLGRLIRHIRHGTLGYRLRKRQRWERAKRLASYVDLPLHWDLRMRLYTDSKLSELIYWENFEYIERCFVRRYLKTGDVFIDVGANSGLFTLEAARLVGSSGRVYAFEPVPDVFQRLAENVKLNRFRQVRLFNEALSDQNGTARLTVSSDGYDAWSSLGHPIAGNDFSVIYVPTRTWSSFVQRENVLARITMMKIDVEGWERRVLRGGRDHFIRSDAPVLQIEFTQTAASNAGSSCSDLYDELDQLGYTISSYNSAENMLVPETERLDYDYKNLYAVKDIECVNKRLSKHNDLPT